MLVPNQLIEITICAKTMKHYVELGYDVKKGDIICVPPSHLTEGSHAIVQVICDICGKVILKPYKQYLQQHTFNMDCCQECKYAKAKQTNIVLYGTNNPAQSEVVKSKMKTTNLHRYGVENASSSEIIKEKRKQTVLERYGVENLLSTDHVKEKIKNTLFLKYGVDNPMKNESIRNKAKQTNILRYECENVMQNPEVQAKAMLTMKQNGTCPTSSQQIQLYNMIKSKYPNAELNYPFDSCTLDIFVEIDNIKLNVEYDGSFWHQDQQRDIRRDKYLQCQGLKVLRVRSGHMLPTEDELFYAINYFITTEHYFKEIILQDWKNIDEKEVV